MLRALLIAMMGLAVAAASSAPVLPSRALEVATMLAQADAQNNRKAQTHTLNVLQRVGARPLLAEDAALLVRWSAATKRSVGPWRGRTLGPGFRHGLLAPGQELILEQIFSGGIAAAAAVSGTPDGSLRLRIVAPDSSAVCDDPRQCIWRPRFTERYRLSLSNQGAQASRYFLVLD